MTLVELLRSDARHIADIHEAPVEKQVTWAAADRIEALEAALREIEAKAVGSGSMAAAVGRLAGYEEIGGVARRALEGKSTS